jgi:hypothetical protein
MSEIIFEVQEDEVDGGYVSTALGHAIVTQGDRRRIAGDGEGCSPLSLWR